MTSPSASPPVEIGLNAAVVGIHNRGPAILTIEGGGDARSALPFGPFEPTRHRTFETSLRASVEAQTALKLGYIEQLYTFGDRGRQKAPDEAGTHMVSVGYLALTRMDAEANERLEAVGARWRDWYAFLPWEDWRGGRPAVLDQTILPALAEWAAQSSVHDSKALPGRKARLRLAFGLGDFPWDEERVLERYELLYEGGLAAEAVTDGWTDASWTGAGNPDGGRPTVGSRRAVGSRPAVGVAMRHDHRRILATAVARLRGKIKYRPVIFELMPAEFTLTELQATVEAISGRHLHKQNFRRLVDGAELVEPTGASSAATGGRPAALFRFRRQILEERPAPGLKVGGR